MNKYGNAALKAVQCYKIEKDPKSAWDEAVKEMFDTKSSREKSCPRSTFLSLCEVGAIKNIQKGYYAPKVKENKEYALKALDILRERNNNPETIKEVDLWRLVQYKNKKHNSQMAVVLALWNNGLIIFN